MKLNYSKIRKVKDPIISTNGSAGIDFFIPDEFGTIYFKPQESVLIPSGIKMNIPNGYTLIAFNKSGICTKKVLTIGAEVIDSDYQGEIHIHLINSGFIEVNVNGGDKIAQFILFEIPKIKLTCIDNERNLYDSISKRGSKGFGSTDSI